MQTEKDRARNEIDKERQQATQARVKLQETQRRAKELSAELSAQKEVAVQLKKATDHAAAMARRQQKELTKTKALLEKTREDTKEYMHRALVDDGIFEEMR